MEIKIQEILTNDTIIEVFKNYGDLNCRLKILEDLLKVNQGRMYLGLSVVNHGLKKRIVISKFFYEKKNELKKNSEY
jgi:hypothetical protein